MRMPVLRHHRHEAFAQRRVSGISLGESQAASYRAVGYKSQGHGAETNASRLLRKDHIVARIQELQERAARKTVASVETVTAQLDADRQLAFKQGQASAAVQATIGKAKINGLMISRSERGRPDSFAVCQTPEQVIDAMVQELGDEHAALTQIEALRQMLLQRIASKA